MLRATNSIAGIYMQEWILIITLSIAANQGQIRDISPQVISGFRSKASCDAASESIGRKIVQLVSKERKAQGIAINTSDSEPHIWFECMAITK